jgi:Zn finger protein HypA/HybF involved in hydrogenase expression
MTSTPTVESPITTQASQMTPNCLKCLHVMDIATGGYICGECGTTSGQVVAR